MKTLLFTSVFAFLAFAPDASAQFGRVGEAVCPAGPGYYKCCPIISEDEKTGLITTNCVPGTGGGGARIVGGGPDPHAKPCYETKRS